MDQEKVGSFIKKIRKDNKLTQKELANKLGVTYQAVSKWENGKNIPDIAIIKEISKLFNIDIDEILDGEKKEKKKNNKKYIIIIIIFILLLIVIYLLLPKKNNDFEFKTISTNCDSFEITGSAAYNKDKSSIYISNISYCGDNNNTKYKNIECNLYEDNINGTNLINACSKEKNITLEEYLNNVKINVNNYSTTCSSFTEAKLYLQINATDINNKVTTYKIPISLNENCSKED